MKLLIIGLSAFIAVAVTYANLKYDEWKNDKKYKGIIE
jgi:hypothetical protein